MVIVKKLYAIRKHTDPEDIKSFRERHQLSIYEFSNIIRTPFRTIERWEYEKRELTGPIVFLMKLIDENPYFLELYRIPDKKYPKRLFYMKGNEISTLIDVDIINRKIWFKNYTTNILFRAFGSKENVTFEDYEKFLESRCFPETRDKMKIMLEALDIPYYDPYLIIEKTEGRMADDDCWICMEEKNAGIK